MRAIAAESLPLVSTLDDHPRLVLRGRSSALVRALAVLLAFRNPFRLAELVDDDESRGFSHDPFDLRVLMTRLHREAIALPMNLVVVGDRQG